MTKARIHRLEPLFRIFEVDDSLPDPEACRDEIISRAKRLGPASCRAEMEKLQANPGRLSESLTGPVERFRRIPFLRDPHTGSNLWVWLPCEVDEFMWGRLR